MGKFFKNRGFSFEKLCVVELKQIVDGKFREQERESWQGVQRDFANHS